jgi:hypothetical protein
MGMLGSMTAPLCGTSTLADDLATTRIDHGDVQPATPNVFGSP